MLATKFAAILARLPNLNSRDDSQNIKFMVNVRSQIG
jgi:hypothetical protein